VKAPRRPLLRWHGGKWRLAPWVIEHFPPHKVYVEPFGGAASVMLQKQPAPTEIWNDLDSSLVTLFMVLREQPEALARALWATPYSRAEYKALYAPTDDPVEASRRFIARSFMGQSSKGALRKSGFDARINPDGFCSRMNALAGMPDAIMDIAGRMRRVLIENMPALEIFGRYDRPDALFYVDPPYVMGTRHAALYHHELRDDDHRNLLARLSQVAGMVVLSGYPSALYDEALPTWRRVATVAYADGARPRTEVLWLNPACVRALDAQGMPLFVEAGE
jgi:DNA adenine methylase